MEKPLSAQRIQSSTKSFALLRLRSHGLVWLSHPTHSWPYRDLQYSLEGFYESEMVGREERISQVNSMMANLGGENSPSLLMGVNDFSD
ncbi:hypothetical protein NPIL_627851 [Nephila pilipes]|uniref:Uncharacterized protein n=1 Tax=Nephila pilipes TaxID=299642 RepID=A0A8X6QU58_NEPPI|nr:hypothetical protein NPIL_627851 [Nephila pilipes]